MKSHRIACTTSNSELELRNIITNLSCRSDYIHQMSENWKDAHLKTSSCRLKLYSLKSTEMMRSEKRKQQNTIWSATRRRKNTTKLEDERRNWFNDFFLIFFIFIMLFIFTFIFYSHSLLFLLFFSWWYDMNIFFVFAFFDFF